MLEADALYRVVQFDVDAEVVGVELELVAFADAAVLGDVQGQRGDGAVEGELPVPVAGRFGPVVDIDSSGMRFSGDSSKGRVARKCMIMQ